MQYQSLLKTGVVVMGFALTLSPLGAQTSDTQAKPPLTKDDIIREAPVTPPRATSADYQAHGQAGSVSIGAEFMEHSIPTPDAIFSTEEYVVVEAGLFGAPGTRLKLSNDDFTLRINHKKTLTSQAYLLVVKSAKDPSWEPPESASAKQSKTSIGSGGGGGGAGAQDGTPPSIPKMPIEVRHTMELRVQKASMPEGDRALPQAGLLYFQYRGKPENIQSLELIYSGAAGNVTLELQP